MSQKTGPAVRRADREARLMTSMTRLVVGGLVSTLVVTAILLLASFQAVATIDREAMLAEQARAAAAIRFMVVKGYSPEDAAHVLMEGGVLPGAELLPAGTDPGDHATVALAGSDRILAWEPRRIGSETFASVAPLRLLLVAGMLLLTGGILYRVRAIGLSLEASRAVETAQARRDPLTGLANRLAFEEAIAEIEREGKAATALLCIDLDAFKPVNDAFGHAAGDVVLQQVAQRLLGLARSGDIVARLGGDEFAILSGDGADRDAVRHYAQAIVRTLRSPFRIDSGRVDVGASIGIAFAADTGASDLVEAADRALYAAKQSGRGQIAVAGERPVASEPARRVA